MKDGTITRMSLAEAIRRKGKGQTDWERLRREQEAGLEPEVDPDEGEFDWSQARVVMPPSKQAISVRIDRDVLDFFKSQGRGYQTRINAALRSYMATEVGTDGVAVQLHDKSGVWHGFNPSLHGPARLR